MLSRTGERAAALEFARKVAAPYGRTPEANLMLAQVAFNASDPDMALRYGRTATELRKDWEPALLFVAQVTASRDPAAAVRLLGEASRRLPASRPIGLAYARALSGGGQYPAALVEFKRLAKLYPRTARSASR
jgi:tetratricopeptide (TPR) repeat protein